VPAQALAMMNDPFVIEQSKFWAREISKIQKPNREKIEVMYEKALGTKPSPDRINALMQFLDQQSKNYGRTDERAWADLGHILLNMKDFVYLK
jgi:uncharacterized protein YneF (UPF0154 family)